MSKYKELIVNDWYSFLISNKYTQSQYYIDENILILIETKVEHRNEYLKKIHKSKLTSFQEIALICFWVIKLHPIFFVKLTDDPIDKLINEKLALYIIMSFFRKLTPNNPDKVSDVFFTDYMKELLYTFYYREISKEAMIILVETIAIAFGINPYVRSKKRKSANREGDNTA